MTDLAPGGEVGEAVQEHVPAVPVARLLQVVGKLRHPVPPVPLLPAQPGLIGGVDKGQVPDLGPGEPLQRGVQLPQLLRLHPVGLQLVKQRYQLPQKGGLPGGPGIHRQLGQHLLEGQLHHEELPAGVQRAVGKAAGEGKDPVGQQAEAQHLTVAGGGGPAGPAEIHLRLVGGVLRHQQQLEALVPQPPDLPQHPL